MADLMASACGIDLDEAEASGDVEVVEVVEGAPVRVAGKRLLVETKRNVRPSDAADVAYYLEAALRAEDEGG